MSLGWIFLKRLLVCLFVGLSCFPLLWLWLFLDCFLLGGGSFPRLGVGVLERCATVFCYI